MPEISLVLTSNVNFSEKFLQFRISYKQDVPTHMSVVVIVIGILYMCQVQYVGVQCFQMVKDVNLFIM